MVESIKVRIVMVVLAVVMAFTAFASVQAIAPSTAEASAYTAAQNWSWCTYYYGGWAYWYYARGYCSWY